MRWVLLLTVAAGVAVLADPPLLTDVSKGVNFQYRIHPSLPLFHFHLVGDPESNQISSIECAREDEPVFQTLKDVGMTEPPYNGSKYFLADDMNFDGYKDIALLSWWGATGNRGYRWWLYNPKTSRFVSCPSLSKLTSPTAHPQERTVTSHSNGGSLGMTFNDGTFRWERGELIPIRLESQQVDGNGQFMDKVVQERRNGKLTVVSRRRLKVPRL